jgi:hypothetical protein
MKIKFPYILIILILISISCNSETENDDSSKVCEGEKNIITYSLQIYTDNKILESGKKLPEKIKAICYPICSIKNNNAYNGNDIDTKESPKLIRIDNGFSENLTATELGLMIRHLSS